MSTRVLLVDDQELVRSGLRAILSVQPDLEVIGEAASAAEAVEKALSVAPDVVLMDVVTPDATTIEVTRRLTTSCDPPVRLLIVANNLGSHAAEILQAGASGLLLKSAGPQELVAAVRMVAAGYGLLAPALAQHLVSRLPAPPDGAKPHQDKLRELSSREREVLELIVRGHSNAEIARVLKVGESTVKSHVQRVLGKLSLRDRTHAVIFAYEVGFARPGSVVIPFIGSSIRLP